MVAISALAALALRRLNPDPGSRSATSTAGRRRGASTSATANVLSADAAPALAALPDDARGVRDRGRPRGARVTRRRGGREPRPRRRPRRAGGHRPLPGTNVNPAWVRERVGRDCGFRRIRTTRAHPCDVMPPSGNVARLASPATRATFPHRGTVRPAFLPSGVDIRPATSLTGVRDFYESVWADAPADPEPWRWATRRALLLGEAQPGDRVLDLGCGAGRFVAALREIGAEPVGVEIAEAALERARRNAPGADLRVVEPDGTLPLGHGEVDLVWC